MSRDGVLDVIVHQFIELIGVDAFCLFDEEGAVVIVDGSTNRGAFPAGDNGMSDRFRSGPRTGFGGLAVPRHGGVQ